MSDDVIDIQKRMKPPRTVGDFIDRALADPKERRAVEKLVEKMRAEQDEPVGDRQDTPERGKE